VGDQLLTDAVVADLACGSGNLGFEALSRGAAHLILLDQRVEALQLARKNAQQLGCDPTSLSLLLGDLTKLPPAPRPCSILFLDPPYTKGLAAAALPQLLAKGWIAEAGAVVIAETGRTEALPIPAPTDAQWQLVDERLIGETRLSFITVRPATINAEAGA
jgi:16S rRNA (guanine966-N2)-methyltransferase